MRIWDAVPMVGGYNTIPRIVPALDRESSTELFVVEGESAAASVVAIRDERYQAVMGMQGKPLNALKASPKKVLANPFYSLLLSSLESDEHDRIVLLLDPDADGIHCSALLLAFFLKFAPTVLESNRLYMARPPVMRLVVCSQHPNANRSTLFAYADGSTGRLLQDVRAAGLVVVERQYFRGLGSIPPQILRDTCVSPKTRSLIQLTHADAQSTLTVFFHGENPHDAK